MKPKILQVATIFFLLLFSSSCDWFSSDDDSKEDLVKNYSAQVTDLHDSLEEYIKSAHDYESANFSDLTVKQTNAIVNAYIESGERFVEAMEKIQETQSQNSSLSLKSASDLPCSPTDFIPDATSGISPGLVKNVADLINETKGDVDLLQKKLDKKEITEDQYNDAINLLKKNKTLKAANVGLGAMLGTGAALGTGLIVGTATLPAIATVTAVGVVVGTSVTWFANWYSGVKSTKDNGSFLVSGKTTVGGKLPVHLLQQGATVTLAIDGYAPITMTQFSLPSAGHNKTIKITPVKLSEAQVGGTAEVCTIDEIMASTNCNDVEFVTASPSPYDPGPGEGVTVTATLIPAVSGCSVSFSISGTDGYSNTSTKSTNSSGQASFYIPGGAEGVFDKVSITCSNGKSYTVSYTF